MINRIKKLNKQNLILFVIFIILVSIPSLFWGNLYQVGGDDTRLYYLFPKEFLQNFVFNIASNNSLGVGTGYTSIGFLAPIIFIIYLLKLIPFLNVQLLMYGLNLGFGFLGFYLFLGLWINSKENYSIAIKLVSSLFYVFSIFLLKTLYTNQLLSIYLSSVVPLSLFLFIKGVETKKIYLILASALIISIFSSTLNTFPWSAAIFITLIPIFLIIFWSNKRIFLIYTLVFLLSLFVLNIYWLIHFIYPYLHEAGSTSLATYVNSDKFKEGSDNLIYALSELNSPLSQMFSYVRVSWMEKNIFSMSYIINIVFIIIISWAGLLFSKTNQKLKTVYVVSVSGLLITFFLFTPNFGVWSVNFFQVMNSKIPFFAIFRNMYDKFSFPMAFYYAFSIAISLVVIFNNLKTSKIKNLIVLLIFLITVFNARNFIFPKHNDSSFSTRITDFNKDYYDLTNYIENMHEASRFMWLPLTKASYIVIEDKSLQNHYYWGPSPLQILSNSSDYTGFLSFSIVSDRNLGAIISENIDDKNFEEIGKSLQTLNTKYIIVSNFLTTELDKNHYLLDKKSYDNQMSGLKNIILGSKIKDFGNKYSLYNINKKFYNEKIFLSDNSNTFPIDFSGISYEKIANYEYKIHIRNLTGEKKLIFLETYNKDWVLQINDATPLENNKSTHAFGYANGWKIDENYIKHNYNSNLYKNNPNGGIDLELMLYFKPQKIAFYANTISLVMFTGSIIFVAVFALFDLLRIMHQKFKVL